MYLFQPETHSLPVLCELKQYFKSLQRCDLLYLTRLRCFYMNLRKAAYDEYDWLQRVRQTAASANQLQGPRARRPSPRAGSGQPRSPSIFETIVKTIRLRGKLTDKGKYFVFRAHEVVCMFSY